MTTEGDSDSSSAEPRLHEYEKRAEDMTAADAAVSFCVFGALLPSPRTASGAAHACSPFTHRCDNGATPRREINTFSSEEKR